MSNTLKSLNDQLHDQLARLNTDIKGKDLETEINRTKAMAQIGAVIVNNNRVVLDAIKIAQQGEVYRKDLTPLLGVAK